MKKRIVGPGAANDHTPITPPRTMSRRASSAAPVARASPVHEEEEEEEVETKGKTSAPVNQAFCFTLSLVFILVAL